MWSSWVNSWQLDSKEFPGFNPKLQVQPEKSISNGGFHVLVGVLVKVSGPDLCFWVGLSGCGIVLEGLWTLCWLKQQASSVQGGERSHAGSILKRSPPSPHTRSHTQELSSKNPPALRCTTFLSPLPRWIIYLRDKSRPVWLYVCALMWPADGKNHYSTRPAEKLSRTDAL